MHRLEDAHRTVVRPISRSYGPSHVAAERERYKPADCQEGSIGHYGRVAPMPAIPLGFATRDSAAENDIIYFNELLYS